MYATQWRAATNDLADSARALFDKDAAITSYYNTKLAGGKWDHMMDQTHIGYTYWQEPPRNTMPRVDVIPLPIAAEMGVAVVEQNRAPLSGAGGRRRASRRSSRCRRSTRTRGRPTTSTSTIEGKTAFAFTASAAQPWVVVSPAKGTHHKEKRVSVSVDWTQAPVGANRVPITITGPKGTKTVVQAPVDNPASPTRDSRLRIHRDRRATSRSKPSISHAKWRPRRSTGCACRVSAARAAAITPIPVTAPTVMPGGNSPRLEYDLFMFDSGTVKVHAYLSPTLNFTGSPDGSALRRVDRRRAAAGRERVDGHNATGVGDAPSPTTFSTRCRPTRSRGPGGTC